MKGRDGVISVGNRHQVPPEFWGAEDWRAEAALLYPLDLSPPIAPSLPTLAAGWHRPPPRRGQSARSHAIDQLLDNLGIELRRR